MTTKPKRKPAKRATSRLAPTHAAAIQALLFDNAVAELHALRTRLLTGDCPAAIPQGERDAAVQDLSRAVAQLGNLRRWYGAEVGK